MRPVITMGDAAPVAVSPPGIEVTVYPVIAEPPVLVGAVNATLALALPAEAVPIVGAPGTVTDGVGVTLFDAAEDGPDPTLFVAVTVKV